MQQNGDSAQRHRETKTNETVNETGYYDHDMQTDTAFEHLEQIS